MITASPARRVPTFVSIYERGLNQWYRVAEFRLNAQGSVELRLCNGSPCPLAVHWYREGIETPATEPLVTAADGPAFMRALLRPFALSYCRIVDESSTPAGQPGSGSPQQWRHPHAGTP
ncbi:hypothetical protein OHB26_23415 [Nocardia sp. NBC_01503]|uniref:hypothetical protein n=1 Tax=Nocardia sp. NBC_01503 TaxID=2975997 RepID=UPI002E7B78C7|nr:hypothetical protein [Nocardia sp. NBC_01503]WTL29907.1 hypothetical protein OHB26_23415 [Nocardia sp. NBC_01503]